MYVERWIRVIAGSFVLLSLGLGVPESPIFISTWALALAVFVGGNLFQFGFTNMCPMSNILLFLGVEPTPCVFCETRQRLNDIASDSKNSSILRAIAGLDMTRCIRIAAGSFIILSTLIGLFLTKWLFLFTAFVGINLLQFGITNFCPMATFLRMGGVVDNENRPAEVSAVPNVDIELGAASGGVDV